MTDHRLTAADQNDRGHKKPPCQEIKAAAARAACNTQPLSSPSVFPAPLSFSAVTFNAGQQ